MRKTLVSLGLQLFFLILSFGGTFGQDISPPEKIKVDPDANFQVTPLSFCATEDNLFLFPDHQAGSIKVFNKEENYLKFIKALGADGFGKDKLAQPMYCEYSWKHELLGVFDYGVKKVFIFERCGKIDFTLKKKKTCSRGVYDIAFAGNGDLVVSGYITDKEDNPFDLYRISIKTGQIDYLLTSAQKYGLETYDQYVSEYEKKQTIPAQGTTAFIDIYNSDLVFIWEASELCIIKIDLNDKKRVDFSGQLTPAYSQTKPDLSKMAACYKEGNFKEAFAEQKKKAYVRNIFSTQDHIFLVYETARNNNPSTFRLQKYSPDGNYQGEFLISGKPGAQMWFNDKNYELYALSKKSESNNKELSILKYKIPGNKIIKRKKR